jgi:protein subunit release factor A
MKRRILFSVGIGDCDVQTFTVGGHGGAGKDTSNTGVRVVHRASGASGESRETRSQLKNKQTAFVRMAKTPVFQSWLRQRKCELETGKTIDEVVDEALTPENLKIEGRDELGRWVVLD